MIGSVFCLVTVMTAAFSTLNKIQVFWMTVYNVAMKQTNMLETFEVKIWIRGPKQFGNTWHMKATVMTNMVIMQ